MWEDQNQTILSKCIYPNTRTMKITKPIYSDIQLYYFNKGQCTITFSEGHKINGVFLPSFAKEHSEKIPWRFHIKGTPETDSIEFYQSQIIEIENEF